MSHCVACNRIIERSRWGLKHNSDLCSFCADCVESSLGDEFPEIMEKEYAHFHAKQGLVPDRKVEC